MRYIKDLNYNDGIYCSNEQEWTDIQKLVPTRWSVSSRYAKYQANVNGEPATTIGGDNSGWGPRKCFKGRIYNASEFLTNTYECEIY